MATLFGMFPFLQKLFADGGYQGSEFSTALAKVRPHLNVEIVKRSDRAKGFVVLSKRWIVERTLAWLNRCRRLAKDWENRNRKALAFLHLELYGMPETAAFRGWKVQDAIEWFYGIGRLVSRSELNGSAD